MTPYAQMAPFEAKIHGVIEPKIDTRLDLIVALILRLPMGHCVVMGILQRACSEKNAKILALHSSGFSMWG